MDGIILEICYAYEEGREAATNCLGTNKYNPESAQCQAWEFGHTEIVRQLFDSEAAQK